MRALVIAAAAAAALAGCDNSPEARAARNCKNDGMAFVMSQKFVKRDLRAPTTAEFPYKADASSKIGDCKFLIIGHVDAQNAFGAMIRSHYQIEMEYLPETNMWRGSKLRM